MGNTFTLDSMREEVEREFAPVTVEMGEGEELVLRNIVRVPETPRKRVFELLDELQALTKDKEGNPLPNSELTGLDTMERTAVIAIELISLVGDNKTLALKLCSILSEDLPLTLKVFAKWMTETRPGEAERSPS